MVSTPSVYDQKRQAFEALHHEEKKKIVIEGLRYISGHPTIDSILFALENGMDTSDDRLIDIYIGILV